MARFRKTAIAAVALSTLVVTSGVAYADHNHRGVSASSDRGMSWGHYSGEVTDYWPSTAKAKLANYPDVKPDIFDDARASAIMIGMDGRSFFRLRVTGIDVTGIDPKDRVFGVHLHTGPCIEPDWVDDPPPPPPPAPSFGSGPHYNVTWDPATKLSELVSKQTEVWLDLNVDSDGDARSTATVYFIPEEGPGSIVLHQKRTAADGTAGYRLACLPFDIKTTG